MEPVGVWSKSLTSTLKSGHCKIQNQPTTRSAPDATIGPGLDGANSRPVSSACVSYPGPGWLDPRRGSLIWSRSTATPRLAHALVPEMS
jgi:hypothetical protein